MTDSSQHHSQPKPSPRQLAVLREMAAERGVTYSVPATAAEARAEFKRLRAIPRSPRAEARRELAAIREAMANGGGASAVREEEIGGYGSTARWR